ncbi:MAG: DEAD/DEAH box helicase family protein [bacterium]|nr:DEAD/DEAH box helicase family protein [bacterium]
MTAYDFGKVRSSSRISEEIRLSPLELFYKLTHLEIEHPRPSQLEVLEKWYVAYRSSVNDNIVSLNTGAGKTLVGLLMAETLRRERNGKVLYVCPNNLLGKQTLDESKRYGLEVAAYLNLDGEGPAWIHEDKYLANESVCITNYDAVLNSRSIFESHEIVGIIFDDAHIALELLDKQYTFSIDDSELIKKILPLFEDSPTIGHKIESLLQSDPQSLAMVPLFEWHEAHEEIKRLIIAAKAHQGTHAFAWKFLQGNFLHCLCFMAAGRIEISPLYPKSKDHYVFSKNIQRVYLSATVPNLGDITRVFGITPKRIESETPDYRADRLFIFSKKINLPDQDNFTRTYLSGMTDKVFGIVPNHRSLTIYKALGMDVAEDSIAALEKILEFKSGKISKLVLSNRYDGIDLPGAICHVLVIDGLPWQGDLKTRFFSEYFHNENNSFLRSIVAAKLVQAFGRTVRSADDYSIILLLDPKLNNWLLNRDNDKFFKKDIVEDLDIGLRVSEEIDSSESFAELLQQVLDRTPEWKTFIEGEKTKNAAEERRSPAIDEEVDVKTALLEREILNLFFIGDYSTCAHKIENEQETLGIYSKPLLGLYLSMASLCHKLLGQTAEAEELSAQAYGINSILGRPIKIGEKVPSRQASLIWNMKWKAPDTFDWSLQDGSFDEQLKKLGLALGFNATRPEKNNGSGTLDVCWIDDEAKVVIGFENKVGKGNKTISKTDLDQCSGHEKFLAAIYPDYAQHVYVTSELNSYNYLASPGDLRYITVQEIKEIENLMRKLYVSKPPLDQLDKNIDDASLRIGDLLPNSRIADLNAVRQN